MFKRNIFGAVTLATRVAVIRKTLFFGLLLVQSFIPVILCIHVSVCVCVLTDYTECVHISINYICNGYILIRAPRGQPTGTIGGMH